MKDTFTALGLLVLRVAIGSAMLLGHGWAKLSGYQQKVEQFPDPLGMGSQVTLVLAIFAEVGCSILLIAGLLTRLAAIPLACMMTVAVFMVHRADPWSVKEPAALYLIAFVVLILSGPGRFSLDAFWFRRRSKADSQQSPAESRS